MLPDQELCVPEIIVYSYSAAKIPTTCLFIIAVIIKN